MVGFYFLTCFGLSVNYKFQFGFVFSLFYSHLYVIRYILVLSYLANMDVIITYKVWVYLISLRIISLSFVLGIFLNMWESVKM